MEVLLMKTPRADGATATQENNNIVQSISHKESCSPSEAMKKKDELESAKAKMGEVKEENERLKMMLEKIQESYNSLQLRFSEILQQGAAKKSTDSAHNSHSDHEVSEHELVSLSLGLSSTGSKNDDKTTSSSKNTKGDQQEIKAGLTLGLDSKFQLSTEIASNLSLENSSEEAKEDDAGETWPPSKIQKTTGNEDHEEVAQQGQVKKARVSVRVRCDAPTMHDGCQWRKYGQKTAKGNPCPRAYYRCTVAAGCPVRKQVQRCAEDMSILITTYEGNHNHPLPISATAMASTTSAAASMLLSGSSTSQPGLNSTATTELNGLNFIVHDSSRSRQFYLPNSPLYPTITLDLTSSPSAPSNHFNEYVTNFHTAARFPTTNINFSSSESNILSSVWGNSSFPANGLLHQTENFLNLGKESQEKFNQFFMEKKNQATASQQSLTETLTKAITSDPNFRSVVAAAVSSMVGGSGTAKPGDQTAQTAESFSQNLMHAMTQNAKESSCASSYFTGLTSSSSQTGSSVLQSSWPLSILNSASKWDSSNKESKN